MAGDREDEQTLLGFIASDFALLRVAEDAGLCPEHFTSAVQREALGWIAYQRDTNEPDGFAVPYDHTKIRELIAKLPRQAPRTAEERGRAENRVRSLVEKIIAAASEPTTTDPDQRKGSAGDGHGRHEARERRVNFGRRRLTWLEHVGRDPELKDFDVRTALNLASFVNSKSGDTFVSQEKLADAFGATDRGVQKALDRLLEHGYLEKTAERHGPGHSNLYRLTLPQKTNSGSSFPDHEAAAEKTNSQSSNDEWPFRKRRTAVHEKTNRSSS
jgi:biotin operon repressor